MWGFTRAGHIYNVLGSAIHEKHNKGLKQLRSLTYIDDGILVSPATMMKDSIKDYVQCITQLMGEHGVNNDKVIHWSRKLEAIGWEFNLSDWFIISKQKGLAKLLILLFETIPVGQAKTYARCLESLTGLLAWYAAAIPAGASFIASLYACQSRSAASSNCNKVHLSELAMNDLIWWRAVILIIYRHPSIIGISIDAARINKIATIFMRTDASSLVGGGGYISLTLDGKPLDLSDPSIRWTVMERNCFIEMEISINVSEYFTVIYFVLLWVDQLRGKIVLIECDNTAAVSWLCKSRAKNTAADSLAKIFTLFCLKENITLLCKHIKGINNDIADFRPRDINIYSQDMEEGIVTGQISKSYSRKVICRNLLYLSVTQPEAMRGLSLLELLTHLHGNRG